MYVNIQDPVDLRRKLLTGIKKTVQIQKRYHEFKKLRTQKFALLQKLHSQLLELRDHSTLIEQTFPKAALKKIGEVPPASHKHTVVVEHKLAPSKRVEDVLSEKLAEIEKRLNALGE